MQWRMPFAAQLVPGVLFILLMIPQPESPRWLVEQERYDEAARTLAYVVQTSVDHQAVLLTLDEIKALASSDSVDVFEMAGSRAYNHECLSNYMLFYTFQAQGHVLYHFYIMTVDAIWSLRHRKTTGSSL